MSTNVYEIVTNQVIAALEKGTVPWQQPWQGASHRPRNLVSGKAYTGINPFLLQLHALEYGLTSPYWVTFKQAQQLNGSVSKGAKSCLVVFFKSLRVKDKDTGEPRDIPMLRFYRLFNLDHTEGVRIPKGRPMPSENETFDASPIPAGEAILASYTDTPTIQHVEARAWYRSDTDTVNVPAREAFKDPAEYYSTLFHELGHSTAHKSRLNRDIANAFSSHEYGREELVAEMTSAFLCADAGILTPFDNSAAYLDSWLRVIKADTKALVVAAGKAQKAADHITGRTAVVTERNAA